MEQRGEEIHIDTEEVRGGRTTGHMRWVLGIGILIAAVAMSLIWIIPAISTSDDDYAITAREQAAIQEDEADGSGDSIVTTPTNAADGAIADTAVTEPTVQESTPTASPTTESETQ